MGGAASRHWDAPGSGASDWSVGCGAGLPAGDGLIAWRLQVGSAATGRGFKAQVETSFLGPGKVIEEMFAPSHHFKGPPQEEKISSAGHSLMPHTPPRNFLWDT